MTTRNIVFVISAIFLILLIGYGLMQMFSGMKKDPSQKPPAEAKIYVKAEKVKYSQITPMVKEGGRLGSQKRVSVISEVQGQILRGDVRLKKGQHFNKGEVIARIFDGETKNNLMASKSRFLNTLANALPDLKIDFNDNYDAWLTFFNSIDIKLDLPAIPDAKTDKEKIFLASRNILNDYYTIKSAEIRLKKYAIVAPFEGSFTEVFFEVGSTVNPGTKLGTIIQTNHLELEVPVKSVDVKWLEIGDKVGITVDYSNKIIKGKIVRIADFVSYDTQTISVFVELKPQNEVKLFEGMYLNASFSGNPLKSVMEMPRSAVFNDNEVYVIEKDRLKKMSIHIHKLNEKTLIFSGIPEGKVLVTEPLINVSEGMKVEVLK